MKHSQLTAVLIGASLLSSPFICEAICLGNAPGNQSFFQRPVTQASRNYFAKGAETASTGNQVLPSIRYIIDAAQSKFMVTAFAGGLLSFKGHDHYVQIREFTGEAEIMPGSKNQASLHMRVKADSLAETRDVFTEQQKQIINKELREIVLETGKYHEIIFASSNVSGRLSSSGQFDANIDGDLSLHGVTRHILIPTHVVIDRDSLKAHGEFQIKRSDFKVKATSAAHGLVRVKDKLKFTFDIVARQS